MVSVLKLSDMPACTAGRQWGEVEDGLKMLQSYEIVVTERSHNLVVELFAGPPSVPQ